MVTIKSEEEIELLRHAGRIVALTHQEVKKHIRPGITTKELDQICEQFILKQGATPSFKGLYGFPGAVCISINDTLVHGIPDDTKLKEGDIVTIDIGACWKGYHGDSAWTYACGEVSDEAKEIMEVTEQALYKGLEQAIDGNRVGDIGHAVETYAHKFGFGVPEEYTGHGVGTEVHQDPYVPNFGKAGHGMRLKERMVIAIEPMIQRGTKYTYTEDDGWTVKSIDHSLSAHYEHTVVIRKNCCEIMTKL